MQTKEVISMATAIAGRLVKTAFFGVLTLIAAVLIAVVMFWWEYGRSANYGFKFVDGQPSIVSWAGGKQVRIVLGADATTFEALPSSEDAKLLYAIDARQVFVGKSDAMLVLNADPATFRVVDSDGYYGADKEHVYWFGREIRGADPETFQVLAHPYARDKTHAYIGKKTVNVRAINDFEVLEVHYHRTPNISHFDLHKPDDPKKSDGSGWSRDGVAYYWGPVELEGAEYKSVEILNWNYAKDFWQVFYKGKAIPGADAATFTADNNYSEKAWDKNSEYDDGWPVR